MTHNCKRHCSILHLLVLTLRVKTKIRGKKLYKQYMNVMLKVILRGFFLLVTCNNPIALSSKASYEIKFLVVVTDAFRET